MSHCGHNPVTPSRPNLFFQLSRWARSQDENFVTESFVILIQALLDREPCLATELLAFLTDGRLCLADIDADEIAVRTQGMYAEGRPDFEVRFRGGLAALFEMKVEAPVDEDQLRRYRGLVGSNGTLVLVTRYPAQINDVSATPDCHRRWCEIAMWLEQRIDGGSPADHASRYLCQAFVEFLKRRGIALSRVSHEISLGVRSLNSLLQMIAEAANGIQSDVSPYIGLSEGKDGRFLGYHLDSQRCLWVGVLLDRPESVAFFGHIYGANLSVVDQGLAGAVFPDYYGRGRHVWINEFDISANNSAFLNSSANEQLIQIERFVRDSLATAKSLPLSKVR